MLSQAWLRGGTARESRHRDQPGAPDAPHRRPVPPEDVQPVGSPDTLQVLACIQVHPGTKIAALVVALRRPQGATNQQLMLATGSQRHSVRDAISGLLRERMGLNVVLTYKERHPHHDRHRSRTA